MLQAIETKYHGPTNTRGARISATTASGVHKTFPYRHELNAEDNHTEACRLLTIHLAWNDRQWFGGATKSGYVFVSPESA